MEIWNCANIPYRYSISALIKRGGIENCAQHHQFNFKLWAEKCILHLSESLSKNRISTSHKDRYNYNKEWRKNLESRASTRRNFIKEGMPIVLKFTDNLQLDWCQKETFSEVLIQSDLCISLITNEMHTRRFLLVHILETNKPVPLVSETIPQTSMNRFWGVHNLGTMRKTQSLAGWQATNTTTLRWHLTKVGRGFEDPTLNTFQLKVQLGCW